jgi:hypothetical protein
VPLRQVSRLEYSLQTEKIRRRNQFRTVTVSAFPASGVLPSEVIKAAGPQLDALKDQLPPGYSLTIGGEQEARKAGFGQLAIVLVISVLGIFLALAIQFKSAIKPIVVFATIPFGVAGALVSLLIAGAPFGFMAFLGIVSLIGVIVSHVIVKFEFIEEMHHKGAPLFEALIEAGTGRLRPVLITVGATVLGLIPLARNGGPLWEPLCFAQIGGLMVATVLTLFLVPVLYTVMVQDLKWMKWDLGADEETLIFRPNPALVRAAKAAAPKPQPAPAPASRPSSPPPSNVSAAPVSTTPSRASSPTKKATRAQPAPAAPLRKVEVDVDDEATRADPNASVIVNDDIDDPEATMLEDPFVKRKRK